MLVLIGVSTILLVIVFLYVFRHALYHYFEKFPAQAVAIAALQASHQSIPVESGWQEFRGVIHSHSHLSHDCEVSFEHILTVLKETKRDFICLSDHCTEGRADFASQWRGMYEGKLFIAGFEMKEGFMPFGVAAGVILSNQTEASVLAQQIVTNGGLLFYAHPEEKRDWERPELSGMEIYNIHADFKDEKLSSFLPDVFLNLKRYPDQVMRLIFDRPVPNLQRWDSLNLTRHITGIAGNDCHQNTGIRGFVTPEGIFRIEDTSPKTLKEHQLNFATRFILRMAFGPLDPGRNLFHVQLDPYERMTRFVSTHVLAKEFNEKAILESLKAGRAFIGFDMLADSSGFSWLAMNGNERVLMGETRQFKSDWKLRAAAPQSCRFTIIKDGKSVHQAKGREVEFSPQAPGTYRVEAELDICGEWTPWIYSNPIWFK